MMDITFLQMTQRAAPAVKQSNPASNSETSFNKVLNETVQTTDVNADSTPAATEVTAKQKVIEEVTEVLEADTLEQALGVLQIEHDDALLFVVLEGELIAIDEAMNVDDLATMLDMTAEALQLIISQLTNSEVDVTDVWQVLEQSPQLLAQIASVLQGDNQAVTPKEAGQLAKFLQLAQLVGQKGDTVYRQELTLVDSKQSLQQFNALLANVETPKQNFTQVMQQAATQTKASQVSQVTTTQVSQANANQVTETNEQVQAPTQQQTPQQGVRTATVVLPMERSAQSEALVKEIQNQLNRVQIANNNGTVKLMLRLFPENLGQIRIEIMQQDGVMQARILATTAAGKELLDSSLNQLKTSLVAQNIQMDRIDIAQSLQSSDASRDQGLFNQFFRQQKEDVEEQKDQNEEEEDSFEQLLEQQLQLEEV